MHLNSYRPVTLNVEAASVHGEVTLPQRFLHVADRS